MKVIPIVLITILDMLSIFLICNMIMTEDEVSQIDRGKWFVCVALFYLVSYMGLVSIDQSIIADIQVINYDILPVNSFGGTISLSILLMICNSKYLKMSNQKSFFGTMFLISILIFIRVFAIIVSSIIVKEGIVYSFLFRIIALVAVLIIALVQPYNRLKIMVEENSLVMKYSVILTFVSAIVLVMMVQFDKSIILLHAVLVIASLSLVLLFNILVIYVQSKQLQRKKRIKVSEQYLPMIEELITEVRARQHEFDNKLTAIFSILEDAAEIEEAKIKIAEYTKNVLLDSNTREILMCENRIIAGVIYAKIQSAKEKKIEIVVDNEATFCNIATPEYEIVEILGILIDNAIEASKEHDVIFIEMKRDKQYLEFAIYNPSISISSVQFMNMFERGHSSKQLTNEKRRGFGLYNVKKIVEQYDGRIITKNAWRNDQNYVMIGIRLP